MNMIQGWGSQNSQLPKALYSLPSQLLRSAPRQGPWPRISWSAQLPNPFQAAHSLLSSPAPHLRAPRILGSAQGAVFSTCQALPRSGPHASGTFSAPEEPSQLLSNPFDHDSGLGVPKFSAPQALYSLPSQLQHSAPQPPYSFPSHFHSLLRSPAPHLRA